MDNELPLEYEQLLSNSKIAPKYHSFYKHGLKNYLSFCNTNNLNVNDKLNLDPFLKFLQLRNYQEFQIKQAHHAVFLFHMSNDEKNISLPEKSIIPTNTDVTNHTDFKEVWNAILEQFKTEIQLRITHKEHLKHTFLFASSCCIYRLERPAYPYIIRCKKVSCIDGNFMEILRFITESRIQRISVSF